MLALTYIRWSTAEWAPSLCLAFPSSAAVCTVRGHGHSFLFLPFSLSQVSGETLEGRQSTFALSLVRSLHTLTSIDSRIRHVVLGFSCTVKARRRRETNNNINTTTTEESRQKAPETDNIVVSKLTELKTITVIQHC